MLSDRAISRSLAPHSCLSRRISRTRRIDTLLAGIGPPARHCHDEQSAEYRPAVERLPPFQGWPTSNRNGRDQIGISGRLYSGIGGRLPPEYAAKLQERARKTGSGAHIGACFEKAPEVAGILLEAPWSERQLPRLDTPRIVVPSLLDRSGFLGQKD